MGRGSNALPLSYITSDIGPSNQLALLFDRYIKLNRFIIKKKKKKKRKQEQHFNQAPLGWGSNALPLSYITSDIRPIINSHYYLIDISN